MVIREAVHLAVLRCATARCNCYTCSVKPDARCAIALLAWLALPASGCTLLMTSSRLPDPDRCQRYGTTVTLDLILASAGTAGLAVSGELESSLVWLALPGLFLASGLTGIASIVGCHRAEERAKHGPPSHPAQDPTQFPAPVVNSPTPTVTAPPPLPPLLRVVRGPKADPPPASGSDTAPPQ